MVGMVGMDVKFRTGMDVLPFLAYFLKTLKIRALPGPY
jgi:hypothetical protein